jgi:hypothetical protein
MLDKSGDLNRSMQHLLKVHLQRAEQRRVVRERWFKRNAALAGLIEHSPYKENRPVEVSSDQQLRLVLHRPSEPARIIGQVGSSTQVSGDGVQDTPPTPICIGFSTRPIGDQRA